MILYVIRLAYLRLAYMDMIVQKNTSKYILYNATLCPIGRVHSFIHSFTFFKLFVLCRIMGYLFIYFHLSKPLVFC